MNPSRFFNESAPLLSGNLCLVERESDLEIIFLPFSRAFSETSHRTTLGSLKVGIPIYRWRVRSTNIKPFLNSHFCDTRPCENKDTARVVSTNVGRFSRRKATRPISPAPNMVRLAISRGADVISKPLVEDTGVCDRLGIEGPTAPDEWRVLVGARCWTVAARRRAATAEDIGAIRIWCTVLVQ